MRVCVLICQSPAKTTHIHEVLNHYIADNCVHGQLVFTCLACLSLLLAYFSGTNDGTAQ